MRFRADSPSCRSDCGIVKAPEMVQNPGVLDDRLTPNPTLSHVAIVVDVDANTITTYYDGEQVTQKSFPAGHLAAMDCGYIGPDAFVALNFKPQYGDPQNTINSGSMTWITGAIPTNRALKRWPNWMAHRSSK